MRVAVLSLTRDRILYSQHCFAKLREHAGCEFDHFVLDQDSVDGTRSWLHGEAHVWKRVACLVEFDRNIGYHRGMNKLLDLADGYDVVVTFDNDCEVVMPGTLKACANIAAKGEWVISPTVQGLNNPPVPGLGVVVEGEAVGRYPAIGGIFRAMPGAFAREFRFNGANPLWGGDEGDVGRAARENGLGMGYLLDWHVNHYETTSGQHARYPEYFQRTLDEGKPAL